MDVPKKREMLKLEFDRLVAERSRLEELIDQIKGRLFQLQGAYKILDEIEAENVSVPDTKQLSAVPSAGEPGASSEAPVDTGPAAVA